MAVFPHLSYTWKNQSSNASDESERKQKTKKSSRVWLMVSNSKLINPTFGPYPLIKKPITEKWTVKSVKTPWLILLSPKENPLPLFTIFLFPSELTRSCLTHRVMALLRPHLHRFHSNALHHSAPHTKSIVDAGGGLVVYPTYGRRRRHRCSAIAIDAPSSLAGVTPIRWGYTSVQGFREEMEDDIVIRSEALDGFSFAAVFDGHAGSSSVKFLRYFMQDQFLELC